MVEPNDDEIIATTQTPDGRQIVLRTSAWSHISSEHPEITKHRKAVLETAADPEVTLADPRPGRRRHYVPRVGPSRWLRVIVDFNQVPAEIVTAHAHRKEPPR